MTKYLAFLRGINVGGKKLIKMDELREMMTSTGLINVKTYIQSGNVSFETEDIGINSIRQKIEGELQEQLGYKVDVLVRTYKELENIVKTDPFGHLDVQGNIKLYISFLEKVPKFRVELPLINPKEGLEIIKIEKQEVYILSREVNGRFGFPNNYIEKELNLLATTRNWTTIFKIVRQIEAKC